VFNLVHDPAFLLVAWNRVRGNRGARSAGVDGASAFYVEQRYGVEAFLADLRLEVKTATFRPLPVRERMIPKAGGKLRRLGIATVRDRVVQAALKLVLEPIWEADFLPCSYGFRPKRRAQDAIAEIRTFASSPWVCGPGSMTVTTPPLWCITPTAVSSTSRSATPNDSQRPAQLPPLEARAIPS
jgi:RNA-directed DNA polymerase